MTRQSDRAREALMDAAEKLFAAHGIDAVSNRRITEQAGTANHSAIKYHFGTRDDLLNALIGRVLEQAREFSESLPLAEDLDAGLREVVTHRVMPWIYYLDSLPAGSNRAQFLFQARSYPHLPEIGGRLLREDILERDLAERTREELAGIPVAVLKARTSILGQMMLGICARYERAVNEGRQQGDWETLGYFLVDSILGMIAAPSTSKGQFLDFGDPVFG